MAGQLTHQNLGPLGSYGMNTQSTPIDLPPELATLALNCYADESGRPTARKAAALVSASNVDLGTDNVLRCYRHNKADGTSIQVLAGPTDVFYTLDGDPVTTVTAGPFASGYWQFASLNGKCFMAQTGITLGYINESTYAYTAVASPSNPIAIHAAYGRLWALSSNTLYWSKIVDGTDFAGAGSGSLDLQLIHTQFRDTAVAITSFNQQLVVLCRNSIYVLSADSAVLDSSSEGGFDPVGMKLKDFIPNVGCIARDTVVTTGDDVMFLSDDGVRSLSRSLQESTGPAPLTDLSAGNRNYVINNLIRGNAATSLCAAWNPDKAWYMLFAADTQEVWLFDMGQKVPETNYPRMFIWSTGVTKPLLCGLWWTDETMWYGGKAGMFTMEAFDANDEYTMTIKTGWLSLGGPERMDAFKKFMINLSGGSGQTATLKWYVDFNENSVRSLTFTLDSSQTVYEFNVDEYEDAEFTPGTVTAETYLNIGGNGKVIQLELQIPLQGAAVTINNTMLFFKQGRVR